MSRIGKQPIIVPNGVTVEINGQHIIVKGSKGQLEREVHPLMGLELKDNVLNIIRKGETKEERSLHGLTRTLVDNMVIGVSKGFEKKLEIIGVGYRATANKNKINLTLGFSHPVEFTAPVGIEFKMDEEKKNIITVSGIDKQIVGEAAAKVRSYKKPEPYKGKGIRYMGEKVLRKAGKAASAK